MADLLPADTIRCDACPVLCYIKRGKTKTMPAILS